MPFNEYILTIPADMRSGTNRPIMPCEVRRLASLAPPPAPVWSCQIKRIIGYLRYHKNIGTIFGRTTHGLAGKQAQVGGLAISVANTPSLSAGLLADGFPS